MKIFILLLLLSFNLQAATTFKSLYKSLGYTDAYFGATEQELSALEDYISTQNPTYKEINGYLRNWPKPYEWYGTSPEQAKVIVQNLDHLFERVPFLPKNLLLHRGLSLQYRKTNLEIDDEFNDEKGYVSTSMSYTIAEGFAIRVNARNRAQAIFTIYSNSDQTKGILIDKGESEVLLKRDSKFRVMDKLGMNYLIQYCVKECEKTARPELQLAWKKLFIRSL
jgi:hypothetical protein